MASGTTRIPATLLALALGGALALLCAASLLLAGPALAASTSETGGASPEVEPSGGAPSYEATAGFTLSARRSVLLRRTARFKGRIPHGHAGRTVAIQRYERSSGWTTVARTRTKRGGAFLARWKPRSGLGRTRIRAVVVSGSGTAAAASTSLPVTIFRPARATWFGGNDGFDGEPLACGGRLTRRTMGVAHRSLPCGTEVAVYFRGRTLVLPVVDRGPYRRGVDWDLTYAAAKALDFYDVGIGTIGAVALRKGR